MSDHTRARPSPGVTPLSGKIKPVKRLGIKFTVGPPGKTSYRITLGKIVSPSPRAISRLRKIVFKCLVSANPHQKNPTTILGDAIVLCVEDRPFYAVASHSIARELIVQQVTVFAKYHSIDIFNYERSRKYPA